MKRMKYIMLLLTLLAVACQNEEIVSQYNMNNGLVIKADIPSARTAYTSEDGVTKVTWLKNDAIGIVDEQGMQYQYLSADSGSITCFQIADSRKLNATEGDTLWAYYPYSLWSMAGKHQVSCNVSPIQKMSEGLAKNDFMTATAVVKDGEVSLRFKHLFAILRMTIPTTLLQVDGDQKVQLHITSSTPISENDGVLDLKTGEFSNNNPMTDIYYELDEELGDAASVVCDIVMLPQQGGNTLSINKLIIGSHSESLYQVNLPEEGMLAGHVYTVALKEEEIFGQVEIDRNALIALYKATGGDNWTNNSNWCSDKPLSEWYGVKTTSFGSVYELNLDYNNLVGTLPPEIGDLAHLNALSLCATSLTGTLPEEFGRLDRLERVLKS